MNGEPPNQPRRPQPPRQGPPRRQTPPPQQPPQRDPRRSAPDPRRRPAAEPWREPPPEGTAIIRRDGTRAYPADQPRAWSEAPPTRRQGQDRRPAPPTQRQTQDRRGAPPGQRPAQDGRRAYDGVQYAPRQEPQPYVDQPRRRQPPRRPTPPAPPPRDARREPPAPRRRNRRIGRILLTVLLVLVLGTVAGVLYLDHSLNRIDALSDYPGRAGDTPGTNWLLVGSDSRVGLTPEQEQQLATGGDVGPSRTDTIIVVHIPKSGATTMVSIPRDSYVSIPGSGKDKINASFAIGGPPLLVQTVETATGLHMDHYAEIGFGGFAGIVDALGGIKMCLDQPVNDPLAGIDLPAGCQKLEGPQALGFVRSRATALADLQRMNNQRMFMSALVSKTASPSTLLNPFRSWRVAHQTAKSLTVDSGDHLWNLASLGWAMRGDAVTTTVPLSGFEDVGASGNVALWDTDRASQFFGALADDQPIPPELLTPGP